MYTILKILRNVCIMGRIYACVDMHICECACVFIYTYTHTHTHV